MVVVICVEMNCNNATVMNNVQLDFVYSKAGCGTEN